MITKFSPRKNLFRDYVPSVIFITRFDLLYKYADLNLKRIIKYWPTVSSLLDKKKFGKNTCRMFHSDKYGTLFILSDQISGFGNKKEIGKQISDFKKWIDEIYSDKEDSFIFRIDLHSFFWPWNEKMKFKLLEIFNLSKKKFEIYH